MRWRRALLTVASAWLLSCGIDRFGLAPEDGHDGGGTDGESLDASHGSDDAPTDGVDETIVDASRDVEIDVEAGQGVTCPPQCNEGCSGGTCTILVTGGSSQAPIGCPAGFACHVSCRGTQVCTGTINCASGYACTVSCNGDQACSSSAINQNGATSLCVECIASGNPGCDSVSCAGTCSLACQGGCGSSCGNCASVPACP